MSGNSEIEGITSYSYVDRYTPPGVLGLVKGWDNPAWIDSSHTIAFNPGADAFPDGVNVAYHELGHANPNALDDMHHAYTWFDDPSASYMVFGDITRKGDKLAVGEDGFAATRTIRLYSVAARPPYKDDAPVYRCRLANPPGDGYESVSLVARRPVARLPGRRQHLHRPRRRDRGRLRRARQAAPARRRRHVALVGPAGMPAGRSR